MINIIDKRKCCGCEACVQKCPRQCIDLIEDEEGFLYPHVDTDKCINCGLCEKVCPVQKQALCREPVATYAAKNRNEEIRLSSSSGGVFSSFAESVISKQGIVFGACFNGQWSVCHSKAETIDECVRFRGSKYVQSHIGKTYKEVEFFLKEGRDVLFSGTPCQVRGLLLYLGKDYDNLLTVDFICHGVPSPGVFRWYLQEEINNYARSASKNSVSFPPIHSIPIGDVLMPEGLEIEDIRFRDKREGWKKYSFVLTLAKATADGKKNSVSSSYTLDKNPFLRGFLKDLYLRPSCHSCPTKSLKSGSDITIADFWGLNKVYPNLDDDKGYNAVLLNTEKGLRIFNSLKIDKVKTSYDIIRKYNSAVSHCSPMSQKRISMFSGEDDFFERIARLSKPTLKEKLKNVVKLAIGYK